MRRTGWRRGCARHDRRREDVFELSESPNILRLASTGIPHFRYPRQTSYEKERARARIASRPPRDALLEKDAEVGSMRRSREEDTCVAYPSDYFTYIRKDSALWQACADSVLLSAHLAAIIYEAQTSERVQRAQRLFYACLRIPQTLQRDAADDHVRRTPLLFPPVKSFVHVNPAVPCVTRAVTLYRVRKDRSESDVGPSGER